MGKNTEANTSNSETPLAELPKQPMSAGVGKLYHRIYETTFRISDQALDKLKDKFFADINCFVPQLLATFQPLCEKGATLKVGDDIDIRISGPWNGPVRVAYIDRNCLKLETLKGHLEAGKIKFEFIRQDDLAVTFRIESFARSKNRFVDFLYDKLPISRFMQREMWVTFCENVVAEGKRIEVGDPEAQFPIAVVDVYTEYREANSDEWQLLYAEH